jgi:hypothetical protein
LHAIVGLESQRAVFPILYAAISVYNFKQKTSFPYNAPEKLCTKNLRRTLSSSTQGWKGDEVNQSW